MHILRQRGHVSCITILVHYSHSTKCSKNRNM